MKQPKDSVRKQAEKTSPSKSKKKEKDTLPQHKQDKTRIRKQVEPDFKSLFESVPGLYMVLDPNLRVVAASDAYLKATLSRREDIIDRHVFEVFPDNPDDPSADAVSNSRASFNQVLKNRVADSMVVQRHDVRKPESEGGGFEVRYWSPVNYPVLNPDGSLAYILHRVENVTELVQLKQQGVEKSMMTDTLNEKAVKMELDLYARSREVAETSLKLKQAEELLRQSNTELEQRVEKRTAELWSEIAERKRAEEERALGNRKMVEVLESIQDGFLTLNRDWRFAYVNRHAADNLGFKPEDLIGQNIWQKFPQIIGTDHEAFYRTAMETREIQRFEIRGVLTDQWYSINIYPSIDGISLYWQDITDRKRAEEALKASEGKYRDLFLNMTEEVHFWKLVRDENGQIKTWRIVDANPPALKSWGRKSLEDTIGRTADEIYPGATEHFMPVVQKFMREGIAHSYVGYFPPPVDKYFHFTSVPMGECFMTTGTDITVIKRAEEAMRTSEERLRRIAQAGRIGFFEWNATRDQSYWSPEHYDIYGIEPGSTVTFERWLASVHPDDRELATRNAATLLERARAGDEGYDQHYEYRILRAGQMRWLESEATLHIQDGQAIVRGALRDITERKRAEERLQDAHQRYSKLFANLLYGIAHCRTVTDEKGNPVNYVILEINEAYERIIGVKKTEVEGKLVTDVFPGIENMPSDYIRKYGRIALEGGELLFEDFFPATGQWLLIYAYRPKPGEFAALFADITAQKQAEESLKEAKESLELRVRKRTIDLQNLTEQLERSRVELRKLASELVMAEERERKRIAGVLHDEIAQTLAAVRMRLDLFRDVPADQKDETLQEAKELLLESIRETRDLMNDLGNPLLFDLGLRAACEALANRLMERSPTRISCDIRETYKNLDPDMKMILYQIVRELLNNIVKHSKAQNAHVRIDSENEHYRVKVTDDGVGFEPQALGAPTTEGGFGLYSMRERLLAVDGNLVIESSPGDGTVVTAVLPKTLD